MREKYLLDKVMGECRFEAVGIQWEVVFIGRCSNVRVEEGKGRQG